MRKFFLLGLSCLSGMMMYSQDQGIATIKQLNEDWIGAYPKKDTATLSRIFSEDFILVNAAGKKMTKSDVLRNAAKQEVAFSHVDSAEIKMLSPDVGVIVAYASFVIKSDGKESKGQTCYQDIYVKRKERWYAVCAHVTSLP